MIHDVIVHMNNEQPLKADLQSMPTPADSCLMCTNLRNVDGNTPTFIDHVDSWFLIPMGKIRFIEVPKRSMSQEPGIVPLGSGPMISDEDMEPDPEVDAELMRRVLEA